MKMRRYLATITLGVSFAGSALFAQARGEVSYDWAPDQLAATFMYTVDDYSLQVTPTNLERTHLAGGSIEFGGSFVDGIADVAGIGEGPEVRRLRDRRRRKHIDQR